MTGPEDSPGGGGLIFAAPPAPPERLRAAVQDALLADETRRVEALADEAAFAPEAAARVEERARALVDGVRRSRREQGGLDAFLREYALSSREGVVLMCLAEALLRVPDAETAERLIRDRLGAADWDKHLGRSDSLFVNASTWALMLTGRLVGMEGLAGDELPDVLGRLVARGGEPFVRQAITAAMRILGRQFVLGRSIEEALDRGESSEARGYRHSFDMLGESARTAPDAERYYAAYRGAVAAIAAHLRESGRTDGGVADSPGISVKLSALHPRLEVAQAARCVPETAGRLRVLALEAKAAGIGVTVDTEEADRLEPTLDILETVFADPALDGWEGLGLAVQAYQKRAPEVLDWLAALARRRGRRIPVRLVKGAYWDIEIKRAQERGLSGYPVFTRKANTDVAFLACARRLFAAGDALIPQLATHNAHTIAAVLEMADGRRDFEFQRLHGMGEALYDQIVGAGDGAHACRIYAPVGSHEDLLPYLVRRLLENGANTSFLNRISDDNAPIEEVVADPVPRVRMSATKTHPRIPLPRDLFAPERRNARGLELNDPATLAALDREMAAAAGRERRAAPVVTGARRDGGNTRPAHPARDPADHRRVLGRVSEAGGEDVADALAAAAAAAHGWDRTPAESRAAMLDRAADILEDEMPALMALIVREGGRTLAAALGEVREAVDFCRYYAARAREDFAQARVLPGPTGEDNRLSLHGRGVFACISPWNFPLSIFTGQVAAALAAGNTVVAKPAEQTPLTAAAAVDVLWRAGVPPEALHFLPGGGEEVGAPLVADPRVAGVAFTGSTETARAINRALAAREGPIAAFIAETGGQNAMIVDSSALLEQVTGDVLASAFESAGQRCSALRALFVQDDIADALIEMLCGAMAELSVGDPALVSTDVGPVIDTEARAMLERHGERMAREGKVLYQAPLPPEARHGTFFAPRAVAIDRLGRLDREVFGPVLHVIRYSADRLDEVLAAVEATGYGLTLGIHSRIESTVAHIRRRLGVGNTYVNRNMVGAVVGAQPFGGERLSGTGPKAGGPFYLHRFAVERAVCVNTTATGGNAQLLSLKDQGPGPAPGAGGA